MTLEHMPLKNPAYLGAIGLDTKKGTAASNAITLNAESFIVTTEAPTTAAAAEYILTMTNASITADSIILVSAGLGTATEGVPVGGSVTVSAGTAVINVTNVHATQALNGTIKISGLILNPKGV